MNTEMVSELRKNFPDAYLFLMTMKQTFSWKISEEWRNKFIEKVLDRAIDDGANSVFILDCNLEVVSEWIFEEIKPCEN